MEKLTNSKILILSLLSAGGVIAYIFVVSLVFSRGETVFGEMQNLIGPALVLLLFVVSAAIVGLLIFGKPLALYLDNKKKPAIRLAFYTIGWLILTTLIALIVQILI